VASLGPAREVQLLAAAAPLCSEAFEAAGSELGGAVEGAVEPRDRGVVGGQAQGPPRAAARHAPQAQRPTTTRARAPRGPARHRSAAQRPARCPPEARDECSHAALGHEVVRRGPAPDAPRGHPGALPRRGRAEGRLGRSPGRGRLGARGVSGVGLCGASGLRCEARREPRCEPRRPELTGPPQRQRGR
jgi:hypothetical protein